MVIRMLRYLLYKKEVFQTVIRISALFPNSLMKSQAHFSFAGGKKVTFSDKISLPANQNGEKLHGHYVFASVNSKESVTVAVMPEKIVTNTVKQNTSTKAVSALIQVG